MTEHIANLNDQMLAQKESIEELTYALSSKVLGWPGLFIV